ncbi:Serine/threonine-protein kinase HRK1 [Smittium mucronatum]|uniref:non-specific serine/threonine protein kinase n=1 Tax=Smittium mucronatum TaxID=133383 RepID=A0A1R0GPW8_9FUNG|nr:Serine/threonine-protein kinase HRK1 [Smittium mucronatum]
MLDCDVPIHYQPEEQKRLIGIYTSQIPDPAHYRAPNHHHHHLNQIQTISDTSSSSASSPLSPPPLNPTHIPLRSYELDPNGSTFGEKYFVCETETSIRGNDIGIYAGDGDTGNGSIGGRSYSAMNFSKYRIYEPEFMADRSRELNNSAGHSSGSVSGALGAVSATVVNSTGNTFGYRPAAYPASKYTNHHQHQYQPQQHYIRGPNHHNHDQQYQYGDRSSMTHNPTATVTPATAGSASITSSQMDTVDSKLNNMMETSKPNKNTLVDSRLDSSFGYGAESQFFHATLNSPSGPNPDTFPDHSSYPQNSPIQSQHQYHQQQQQQQKIQAKIQHQKQQQQQQKYKVYQARQRSLAQPDKNAIDGSLSVTIRPVGYIKKRYGLPIKSLGAGTGGQVDLYRNPYDKKFCAIKTFKNQTKETSGTGRVARSCLAELAINVNVRHRNIIKTFDIVMEYNQSYYAIMEHCPIDLFTLLQTRKLNHDEIYGFFAQLIEGVAYLHQKGIAHRDLKLDNCCIAFDGTLKIIDFGCATIFKRKVPKINMQANGGDGFGSTSGGGSYHPADLTPSYKKYLGTKNIKSVDMQRQDYRSPLVAEAPVMTTTTTVGGGDTDQYSKGRECRARTHGWSNQHQHDQKEMSSDGTKSGFGMVNGSELYGLSRDRNSSSFGQSSTDVPSSDSGASPFPPPDHCPSDEYVYVDLPSMGLCGSNPYIAPELYLNAPYDSRKADVWASGIILLSMTNLHFPWDIALEDRDKNYHTFTKIPSKFIDFWLQPRREPADLIRSMLEINPNHRFSIESVMSHPWFKSINMSLD